MNSRITQQKSTISIYPQCDWCGSPVSSYKNGCPGCGAPQCCQRCCDAENDPVAQSVEQGSDKAVVAGSSPAGVATTKPGCFDCDYGNQPCHMNCGPARTRATAEALLETIYKDRVAVCCGPEAIWDTEADMLAAPENAIWKNIADFIYRNEP